MLLFHSYVSHRIKLGGLLLSESLPCYITWQDVCVQQLNAPKRPRCRYLKRETSAMVLLVLRNEDQ